MALPERFIAGDDPNPIDMVETVLERRDWDFDRLAEDQLSATVGGQWRSYALLLAWSAREEVLRLICTFDMDPPAHRLPELYETLNLANDQVWDGGFTFWPGQKLMVWRYGLVLAGESGASADQIDAMIGAAISSCERFYPSFQLTAWGNAAPVAALDIALGQAYGRA